MTTTPFNPRGDLLALAERLGLQVVREPWVQNGNACIQVSGTNGVVTIKNMAGAGQTFLADGHICGVEMEPFGRSGLFKITKTSA